MLAASRLIRHPPTRVFPSAYFSYNLSRKTTSIKFHKGPDTQESSEKMEKSNADQKTRGESMGSFGEGYSTRSDDEGFGGVYGGNQDQHINEEEKKHAFVNSYEFDKSQGSEVKEKEKARHQKHDQS